MLIVLDGLDGCGKSTQFALVRDILSKTYTVTAVSFPDYDSPSSAPVKMYLNGEISKSASDINPYAASSFYAVDRYISYKKDWEKNYKDGEIILTSRYTGSNAIHQMSKLAEPEWDSYLDWLYGYEFVKLALPAPDLTVLLDMPPSVSDKLLNERYGGDDTKKDIHESDRLYRESCRKAALYAAKKLNWTVIQCCEDDKPLEIETVTNKILKEISRVVETGLNAGV